MTKNTENIDIENLIIYRDGLIIAIDKPAGIPVHKGTGPITPLENYFDALRFGLPEAPKLAHRLDKDTSGCLVLGRNKRGLHDMGRLFENNQVSKEYIAIVEGCIEEDNMLIDAKIAPISSHKSRWWVKICSETGKESITNLRVIKRFANHTMVSLIPKTGRTHQLRIHMKYIGHPIVGDKIYGNSGKNLMLHCHQMLFKLYKNKPEILIEAPLPKHFTEFYRNFLK